VARLQVAAGATSTRAGHVGEPTPMPSVLAQAAQETELRAAVNVLATDPKDRLAAVLASLGRAFLLDCT
jgi:hypothetical protein